MHAYIIAADDWKVNAERIIETVKSKKQGVKDQEKDKGWKADLVPKETVWSTAILLIVVMNWLVSKPS